MSPDSGGGAHALAVFAALALLGGAGFALFVSLVVEGLGCVNVDAGELEDCHRLGRAQLIVASLGLVAAVALVVAAVRRQRKLAAVALAVGLPIYLAWAILLDASVHGWDNLTLLP